MADNTDKNLNTIFVEQILNTLSAKDRKTMTLWASGYSLYEIANIIGEEFDGRSDKNPLGSRAMGARIGKIIEKIQKKVIEGT